MTNLSKYCVQDLVVLAGTNELVKRRRINQCRSCCPKDGEAGERLYRGRSTCRGGQALTRKTRSEKPHEPRPELNATLIHAVKKYDK